MKACELMVGDFIHVIDKVFEFNAKVSVIDEESVCVDGVQYPYHNDEITPIPLTEKILKANFKEGAMENFYYTDGIEIYVNEAGVNVVAKFGIYGSHLDYYCLYVHELQHALRLCGLNELADNFKVGGEG